MGGDSCKFGGDDLIDELGGMVDFVWGVLLTKGDSEGASNFGICEADGGKNVGFLAFTGGTGGPGGYVYFLFFQ